MASLAPADVLFAVFFVEAGDPLVAPLVVVAALSAAGAVAAGALFAPFVEQ
jgi:hypothetical protein